MMNHRNLTSTPRPSVVSLPLPSQTFWSVDEAERAERAQLARERASQERVLRMLQANNPLARLISRVFLAYSYFGLLSWIVIGTFLWTAVSDVIIVNCPQSELINWKMFILLMWGTAAWIGVIQKGRFFPLFLFSVVMVLAIAGIGSFLQRFSQYNLTDEELDFYQNHFTNSGSKLLPIGECMLGHKMALGMVHLEFVLSAPLALVHFVPVLVTYPIALCRGIRWLWLTTKYYVI